MRLAHDDGPPFRRVGNPIVYTSDSHPVHCASAKRGPIHWFAAASRRGLRPIPENGGKVNQFGTTCGNRPVHDCLDSLDYPKRDFAGEPGGEPEPMGEWWSDIGRRSSSTLEISPMKDPATRSPVLLTDLEHRQEDVIRKLDDLNRQIEQAVSQSRLRVETIDNDGRGAADA
jgi:hypothetical protein